MNKSTKVFLILIGLVSIGAGVWAYFSENEDLIPYFAIFIGIALIATVISIPSKNKES